MIRELRRFVRRARNVLGWSSVDRDLRDEVAHHVEMATAEYERLGLDHAAARRRAVREFGGDRWLEESRHVRGITWLQNGVQDIRYALRVLRRQPVFTAAVVIVLALGMGATTAVYSVLRGVLLSPLPYHAPDELFTMLEGNATGSLRLLSYPTYREVAEAAAPVAEMAWIRGESVVVRHEAGTMNLLGAFVTPGYFDVMGRGVAAGRVMGREEEGAVVVLSARLAQRLWGDARTALGGTLVTADGSYTVIGVLPADFAYPQWADFWAPLNALPAPTAYALEQRDLRVDSDAIIRVRPDVGQERVLEALAGPIDRASLEFPEGTGHFDRALLTPLRDRVLGTSLPPLGLLFGAALLVLVLAAVNVAGLMLARGLARRRELAARAALGAGRGRLVRQLVTESLLLGIAGGIAGGALAAAAIRTLRSAAPGILPRLEEISLDPGMMLFALGITMVTSLLFGVPPALRITADSAAADLRTAGATSALGDADTARLRGMLVVTQIGLAVVLLVGATLLVRSARELARAELGYDPDGIVVIRVMPPGRYADDGARLLLYEQLRDAVRRVPGVERVALANHIPSTFASMPTPVFTERTPAEGENLLALFRSVSTDYLQTIGATAVAGRLLTDADAHGTGLVVNETLARREWGTADAVGRPITIMRSAQGAAGFGEPLQGHVVGVMRDMREQGPATPAAPAVYVPLQRNVWGNIHLVVASRRPAAAMSQELRAAVYSVDPDIPTAGPHHSAEFRSLGHYQSQLLLSRRVLTGLLTSFAGVALVLALAGLVGVLAFTVTQRRREIGVRMALGAGPTAAVALVVRQSFVLVVLGLGTGVLASLPATRLLEASLFGIGRIDALSYVTACALFLTAALLAAGVPARRAAGIDPASVLRSD